MAIKLVVKENGTELWLSFDKNTMVCLNNIANGNTRIIKQGMRKSIAKYLEIHKMAAEFDMIISDSVRYEFPDDHPIMKMHIENCELKNQLSAAHRQIVEMHDEIDNLKDARKALKNTIHKLTNKEDSP